MAVVVVNVGGGSGGKQIISGRMRGASPAQAEPLFIQWGTGAGTAAVADTGLFSTASTTESRTTGTSSQQTGAQTNSKWRVVGTITAAGARTILEVGLFDAVGSGSPASGGNFFLHADHGSTTLATNDTITYTIDLDFTP
jgi:hypothetical protein